MTYDIQFVKTSVSEFLENLVSEKLYGLSQKFDWVINAEVILKKENTKRGRGKLCEIKLSLPGPTIFASSNEDRFEVSIAETIRDLEIQLKKRKGLFHPY
jgi:putative sigma-54 modulation protein